MPKKQNTKTAGPDIKRPRNLSLANSVVQMLDEISTATFRSRSGTVEALTRAEYRKIVVAAARKGVAA